MSREQPLGGLHVVVTGGGTGLGFATAKSCRKAGARVTIVGRREDVLKRAVESIGEGAAYVTGDIAHGASMPALARQLSAIEPVDVLVSNAGTHHKASALETSDDEFRLVIETNLVGSFSLVREVAREMVVRNTGSIIVLSSMAALFGIPNVSSYSASKAGLLGLTRELAVELGPRGVRVNAIAPGFIETDMNRSIFQKDPDRLKRILARTPLGQLGTAQDVAEAVVYLASPASRFVTGICLPVDGGMSIGF